MKTLGFSNPIFNKGVNLTVRRGIKWSLEEYAMIGGFLVKISSIVIRFSDINSDMLDLEHDPTCRTTPGLFNELQRIYPDFNANEIVTLVTFVL